MKIRDKNPEVVDTLFIPFVLTGFPCSRISSLIVQQLTTLVANTDNVKRFVYTETRVFPLDSTVASRGVRR